MSNAIVHSWTSKPFAPPPNSHFTTAKLPEMIGETLIQLIRDHNLFAIQDNHLLSIQFYLKLSKSKKIPAYYLEHAFYAATEKKLEAAALLILEHPSAQSLKSSLEC